MLLVIVELIRTHDDGDDGDADARGSIKLMIRDQVTAASREECGRELYHWLGDPMLSDMRSSSTSLGSVSAIEPTCHVTPPRTERADLAGAAPPLRVLAVSIGTTEALLGATFHALVSASNNESPVQTHSDGTHHVRKHRGGFAAPSK